MLEQIIKATVFLLWTVSCIWHSVLSCPILCCLTLSCSVLPPPVFKHYRGQVLLCVDSQCHSAQLEDKDCIEEAGMEQGAAQDTLTDRPVFVPSLFLHTHNRHCVRFLPTPSFVLSGSVSLPPTPSTSSPPPFLFGAGWLALDSASRV